MAGGKDPELRLGLVLYGGVSLAVYIYGVVVEVQRLLRASAEFEAKSEAGVEGADQEGGYATALREGGLSRASVDIIAGTSAGGINGILLAKALATGGDVTKVKKLWIEEGDIGGLLRRLDDAGPESLLSTKVMEEQLADGFALLDQGGGPVAKGPLDLFVSSTHLRGDRQLFRDSLGHGIDTLEHRFVFELKRRPDYDPPHNDFVSSPDAPEAPEPNPRLVKLSRATSAFPVAFEPLEITPADELLGPHHEPAGWFSDGGILNNKPFTEALQTIFTRSSDRPVQRWLLSVDPDPKAVVLPKAPGLKPAFDQIALDAVAGIPRYQSIAHDLEALDEHNAAVRRADAGVIALERDLTGAAEPAGWGTAPASYRRLRRRAWAAEVAARLTAAAKPEVPADFDPEATRAACEEAALSALGEADLEAVDLAFELRRAYYLVKLIAMAASLKGDRAGADPEELRRGIWQGFEQASHALWSGLAKDPLPIPGGAAGAETAFEPARKRVAAALEAFRGDRERVVGTVAGAVAGATLLLPAVAPGEGSPTFEVRLDRVFAGFLDRDAFMLPTEAAGLRHRDLVQHAQISPATATSIGVRAGKKLAGDAVGHFGGFLDERWRKNDLLWGRLDAAEIIVGAIAQGSPPGWRAEVLEKIHREILEEEERPEAKLPAGQWQAALDKNAIGEQTQNDLDPGRIDDLKARAGFVLRGMIGWAAKHAVVDPAKPSTSIRRRVLAAADGMLRVAGRVGFLWVARQKRRARRSEPKD